MKIINTPQKQKKKKKFSFTLCQKPRQQRHLQEDNHGLTGRACHMQEADVLRTRSYW